MHECTPRCNVFQRKWHILFGHPMDAVESIDGGQPGVRVVTFRCNQCGRTFDKQLPRPR